MASYLLGPLLDAGIRLTITAAGRLFYYTGNGIWWLGKRAIYGRQLTPEEERLKLIRQNDDLAEQVQMLREMVLTRELHHTRVDRNEDVKEDPDY